MKKTYKTMELLMDEYGEVFSKSEISARDEVIKFTKRTQSSNGNIDPRENAEHYCKQELVRGA